jgi:PilZ domain
MATHLEVDHRSGPRYLASLEVRAEWDNTDGTHIVTEGTTENIGPEGTLVHLPRHLPQVGGRVSLEVHDPDGKALQVVTEVLRIERNPGYPLAALQLLNDSDEWKGLIWEPSAPRVMAPPVTNEEEDEEEDD